MDESLLTSKEIAKFLDISEYSVLKYCRLKEIPHLKLGGIYRFDKAIVLDWVKSKHESSAIVQIPRVIRQVKI